MSKSKSKKKDDSATKKNSKTKDKSETEVSSKKPTESKPKAQKEKKSKKKAEEGPGVTAKIRASLFLIGNFVQRSLIAISAFLRRNIKGITAALGILLLLFAIISPGISFTLDSEQDNDPLDIMWNGDLVNSETGATDISYDGETEFRDPFLTDPLTPSMILYLGVIIAILGLLLRQVAIMLEKPDYEKTARYSVQFAVILFWAALGILTFYFLAMQGSSRGIDLFGSIGAISVILGSVALIPVTMPYDFEGEKS
ncbi:MAG: hypothetical protein ACFFB3_11580 [Candidatus Hodarchaeota archaeon]